MTRNVCSVSGNLVGDNAILHVFLIGQAEVLLRRNVTEHVDRAPLQLAGLFVFRVYGLLVALPSGGCEAPR